MGTIGKVSGNLNSVRFTKSIINNIVYVYVFAHADQSTFSAIANYLIIVWLLSRGDE